MKHYMQHILSSSISSYISLGIKCISPMTTAYHPCLIQLVHSTLFIHMNIFAKFRFYALPSSRIMVHELQYSNIYYSPVYLCSYGSTTIVIIPKQFPASTQLTKAWISTLQQQIHVALQRNKSHAAYIQQSFFLHATSINSFTLRLSLQGN